ncbi:MAG: serine--tRNA ligase, partial [Candidatus Nealsonbacteria bacterium CG08_land_8_20_14_0_20_43_11]
MLDIKFIRENPDKVKQGAKNKGVDIDIAKVLKLDKQKRELMVRAEQIKSEQNKLSKGEITDDIKIKAKDLKDQFQKSEAELKEIEENLN